MKKILALASLAFACNAFAGGYLDRADGFNARTVQGRVEVAGWACDTATPDFQGWVHFWGRNASGPVFLGALPANIPREPAVGALCGGNHVHGFSGSLYVGTYLGRYSPISAHFIPLNGSPFELSLPFNQPAPLLIEVPQINNPEVPELPPGAG